MADKIRKYINAVEAATGANSLHLERALRAGVITPDMDPETAYRAASKFFLDSRSKPRQLELPIGPEAAAPDIRALLPKDSTPAVKAKPDIPVYDPGALPQASRISTLFPADQPLPIPRPQAPAPARIAEQFDRSTGVSTPDYGPWKAAGGAFAGAGLVGAAANALKQDGVAKAPTPADETGGITSTAGTADLANESRPAPVVTPNEEDEKDFTNTFKQQYTAREKKREAKGMGGYANKPQPAAQSDPRDEAQALIADLNERRRKAGGEVQDAPQTMARIKELLAASDAQRNGRSPSEASAYAKSNPNDYHAQASSLIAQLNDMRRKAGGEVPQAQQIMAEVRRLQALGDKQRNSAQTGRY